MAYKTCVVLAERSPKNIRETLRESLKCSDYAEIRFDFMKVDYIPPAAELVKRYFDRCVCTVRSRREDGRFRGDEVSRAARLEFISGYRPYMLDVEYQALRADPHFRRHIESSGANILVSWHDFTGTPKLEYLREKMSDMLKLSSNVKIVTKANSTRDVMSILSLYRYAPDGTSLVAFAMGELGKVSRITCMEMGSPFTYVSLGKPVAPGQFSLAEIRPILKVLKKTEA